MNLLEHQPDCRWRHIYPCPRCHPVEWGKPFGLPKEVIELREELIGWLRWVVEEGDPNPEGSAHVEARNRLAELADAAGSADSGGSHG